MNLNIPKRMCKICNIELSSKQSLWNHNNRFHNKKHILSQNVVKLPQNIENISIF